MPKLHNWPCVNFFGFVPNFSSHVGLNLQYSNIMICLGGMQLISLFNRVSLSNRYLNRHVLLLNRYKVI